MVGAELQGSVVTELVPRTRRDTSGVSEEHSRSSMKIFMTSRRWQREREVAGCFRFWRERLCQQCIWCDCSQVVHRVERLGFGVRWSDEECLGVQIGWCCYATLRGQSPRRIEDVRTTSSCPSILLRTKETQDSKALVKTKSDGEEFATASTATNS